MRTTNQMVLFWQAADIYSNWYPAGFEENGMRFANSEQYLMWRKAMLFGDAASAATMVFEPDPAKLKVLGRGVQGYDQTIWLSERLTIMVRGCYLKFAQNPRLGAALQATGDRVMVEASPDDTIWGIGLDESDPRALDRTQWLGLNLLGDALMEVRRMLSRGGQSQLA